jgi:hypothetical protein
MVADLPAAPRLHVVRHSGACGERIPSPHERCQALTAPYLAAELVTTTRTAAGHVRVTLTHCHGCGQTWQASA